MEYILHILIVIGIYVMLAQSLCLSAGFGGFISLAHAGFYGIGAYTTAILSVEYQMSFGMILLVALVLCGIIALMIAAIALRTIDDYFIICTLGIQVIVFSIMNNWMSVTNGPLGISGIHTLTIFSVPIDNKISYLIITLIFAFIVFLLLKHITCTAFGKTLRSLSEDEIFTASLGKNVYLTKLVAFTLSGMFAAIPGIIYAYYITYVNPSSFTVDESIFILSIVIIGGMRNYLRIIYASIFLILLPEILRFVGLPSTIAANFRQIIYGLILIFLMFRNYKPCKST